MRSNLLPGRKARAGAEGPQTPMANWSPQSPGDNGPRCRQFRAPDGARSNHVNGSHMLMGYFPYLPKKFKRAKGLRAQGIKKEILGGDSRRGNRCCRRGRPGRS